MKVIALINFYDAKEGASRFPGGAFDCEEERARYLEALGWVKIEKPTKKGKRK